MDDLVLGRSMAREPGGGSSSLPNSTQAMRDHQRRHLLLVTRDEALAWLTANSVGGGARHEITGLTRGGAVAAVVGPALAAGGCSRKRRRTSWSMT